MSKIIKAGFLGFAFIVVATVDYGSYPNLKTFQVGCEIPVNFPANFNPVGLGSATPQDFADSLAAQINTFFEASFGVGNFTPLIITHSADGTDEFFTTNDAEFLGRLGINSVKFDQSAVSVDQITSTGSFCDLIQINADRLLNSPTNYPQDITYRGK